MGVSILQTPPYEKDFQISEEDLKKEIEKKIKYKNPEALNIDINSVRSIFVLREGRLPTRLEDSIAVFVTSNDLFAAAAFELGKSHNSTKEVSSVITEYSLINVSWLKAPLGAPELPVKQMMAKCYAAMEPKEGLWHKYLAQADELLKVGRISPDDHAILRASDLAREELMNLTQGEESALKGGSISEILERVKTEMVVEKDKLLEIKQNEIKEIKLNEKKIELELEAARESNEKIISKIYWLSESISDAIAHIIVVLLLTAIIVSVFYSFLIIKNETVFTVILIMVIVGIMFTIINSVVGLTLITIYFNAKRNIHNSIFNFLKKWVHDV